VTSSQSQSHSDLKRALFTTSIYYLSGGGARFLHKNVSNFQQLLTKIRSFQKKVKSEKREVSSSKMVDQID